MSYGLNISFHYYRKMKKGQLIKKAHNIVGSIGRNPNFMDEFLKNNEFFIPSLRYMMATDDEKYRLGGELDRFWFDACLQMQVLVWPQYHLIGIIGQWPCVNERVFKPVYFQNSCDQNYGVDTWQHICPMFDQVVKQWTSASFEQLQMKDPNIDESDWKNQQEGLRYERETMIYREIFHKLDLKHFLYPQKTHQPQFTSLIFQIPHTFQDEIKLRAFVKKNAAEDFREKHKDFRVISSDKQKVHVLRMYYKYQQSAPTEKDFFAAVAVVTKSNTPESIDALREQLNNLDASMNGLYCEREQKKETMPQKTSGTLLGRIKKAFRCLMGEL